MTHTRNLVTVLAVMAMAVGACGDDSQSGDTTSPTQPAVTGSEADAPSTTGAEAPQDDGQTPEQQGEEGQSVEDVRGEGTFAVGGEQIRADWVVRCAPSDDFGGNPDERDLELIAHARDAGFLTINVGVEDLEGLGEDNYTYNTFSLDWGQSVVEEQIAGFQTSPDGDWYFGADSLALARGTQTAEPIDPPFTMEGDRISGAIDIAAIDPDQPDGASIEFDLSIPPQAVDCSEL